MVRAKDRNVEESLDLGNGVHLENVEKFCNLGDMLDGMLYVTCQECSGRLECMVR